MSISTMVRIYQQGLAASHGQTSQTQDLLDALDASAPYRAGDRLSRDDLYQHGTKIQGLRGCKPIVFLTPMFCSTLSQATQKKAQNGTKPEACWRNRTGVFQSKSCQSFYVNAMAV
jgi:hypothetical protein